MAIRKPIFITNYKSTKWPVWHGTSISHLTWSLLVCTLYNVYMCPSYQSYALVIWPVPFISHSSPSFLAWFLSIWRRLFVLLCPTDLACTFLTLIEAFLSVPSLSYISFNLSICFQLFHLAWTCPFSSWSFPSDLGLSQTIAPKYLLNGSDIQNFATNPLLCGTLN